MCNLSEGFWEAGRKEGIEIGIKLGIALGIQLGIQQGIKEGRITVLKNGLNMGLPEEKIQQILEISVEEMNQLKQELFECV